MNLIKKNSILVWKAVNNKFQTAAIVVVVDGVFISWLILWGPHCYCWVSLNVLGAQNKVIVKMESADFFMEKVGVKQHATVWVIDLDEAQVAVCLEKYIWWSSSLIHTCTQNIYEQKQQHSKKKKNPSKFKHATVYIFFCKSIFSCEQGHAVDATWLHFSGAEFSL